MAESLPRSHGLGSVSGRDEGPSTRQTGGSGRSLAMVGKLGTGNRAGRKKALEELKGIKKRAMGKLKGMKRKRRG